MLPELEVCKPQTEVFLFLLLDLLALDPIDPLLALSFPGRADSANYLSGHDSLDARFLCLVVGKMVRFQIAEVGCGSYIHSACFSPFDALGPLPSLLPAISLPPPPLTEESELKDGSVVGGTKYRTSQSVWRWEIV